MSFFKKIRIQWFKFWNPLWELDQKFLSQRREALNKYYRVCDKYNIPSNSFQARHKLAVLMITKGFPSAEKDIIIQGTGYLLSRCRQPKKWIDPQSGELISG